MEQEEIKTYSFLEAAKKVGIGASTLSYWYIAFKLLPEDVKERIPFTLPEKRKSEWDERKIAFTDTDIKKLSDFSNWFHKRGGRGLFRTYNRKKNHKDYKSDIIRGYKYESK